MWETRSVFQGSFIAVIPTAADGGKFSWSPIGQRGVRTVMVVIVVPEGQLAASIGQREEDLHVQALVAQSPVEALDIAVLDRPSRPDEIQMHAVPVSPEVHGPAGELGPVVDGDRLSGTTTGDDNIECRSHPLSAEGVIGMEQQTLAGYLAAYRHPAHPATIGQPLSHKIHAPLLVRPRSLS